MGAFDLKIPDDGGDVVDRELPAIQRCIFGDITGWVASGIVGNATVATREVTHLRFPTADVRCEFMDEDDRITVTTLLEIELSSGRLRRSAARRLRLGDQVVVPKLDARARVGSRGHHRSSQIGLNSR